MYLPSLKGICGGRACGTGRVQANPRQFTEHPRGFQGTLLLTSLPVFYMMFGMLAMDGHVILKELFYGSLYVITGIVVWRIKSRLSYLVMALAWLSHGFYDYYHDVFFINPGVFSWYPAFCALVDISVSGYLLANFNRVASAALPVDDG